MYEIERKDPARFKNTTFLSSFQYNRTYLGDSRERERGTIVSVGVNPKRRVLVAMGTMQLCHHHDRRVAQNRNLGYRAHVRSTKFDVDWERRCFALVVGSFDKHSLLSLILILGNICLPVVLYSFEKRYRFWKPSRRRELWTSLTRDGCRVSLGSLAQGLEEMQRYRDNAATFHAIESQSSPCGFGLEEGSLSWSLAYENQAAKTAWIRKNS